MRLDEVDLADMTVVQQLAQELDPGDRSAFATFAAVHGRAEAGTCGITLGGLDGKAPETVGEAIQAMKLRLAQVQPTSVGEAQPRLTAQQRADAPRVPRGATWAEVNERLDVIGR